MQQIWKSLTITLLKPITIAGNNKTSLMLTMLSHDQHRTLIDAAGDDTTTIYRELVKAGTGLTESELKQLVAPDYNSLLQAVDEAYGNTSDYWFDKLETKQSEAIDRLPLLVPITTAQGQLDALTLQLPTVAALDLMDKQPEDQRDLFIKVHCAGLAEEELNQLAVPDWKALDQKVADFLSQTGNFFSAGTTSNA